MKFMDIFVNKNELFDITVPFVYIRDSKNKVTGVKIVFNKDIEDDVFLMTINAKGRDFDTMSKVMEEASIINHITGKPVVRTRILYKAILDRFFISADIRKMAKVEGEEEKPVTIMLENFGQIYYDLVCFLVRKWLKTTSGKPIKE